MAIVLPEGVHASELVLSGPGESLTVEIAEVETVFMHGLPSMQFTLTDASSEAMADFTANMIGRELTVMLCDSTLVRAVVRERISGKGIINLPTPEAAIAVTNVLRDEADCATLAPHFPD